MGARSGYQERKGESDSTDEIRVVPSQSQGILYSGTKENIREIITERDMALQED